MPAVAMKKSNVTPSSSPSPSNANGAISIGSRTMNAMQTSGWTYTLIPIRLNRKICRITITMKRIAYCSVRCMASLRFYKSCACAPVRPASVFFPTLDDARLGTF